MQRSATTRYLLDHVDEVLAAIEGGRPVPEPLRAALAEYLRRRFAGAQAQRQAALARTQERHASIERAILAALARVPRHDHVDAAAAVAAVTRKLEADPVTFGLLRAPCVKVIRRVVRAQRKKIRNFETERATRAAC